VVVYFFSFGDLASGECLTIKLRFGRILACFAIAYRCLVPSILVVWREEGCNFVDDWSVLSSITVCAGVGVWRAFGEVCVLLIFHLVAQFNR